MLQLQLQLVSRYEIEQYLTKLWKKKIITAIQLSVLSPSKGQLQKEFSDLLAKYRMWALLRLHK